MIYERKHGHQYTVENGYSRPDGQGGRIVKLGLMAVFEPRSPMDPTAEFDTARAAATYVDMNISAGNIPYEHKEAKVKETDQRLQSFIEGLQDFTRPGGLGLIWRQKTVEERAAMLEQSIQAQQDRLREMKDSIKDKSEAELEELTRPEVKTDGMAKQPGVITGGATTSTPRGK